MPYVAQEVQKRELSPFSHLTRQHHPVIIFWIFEERKLPLEGIFGFIKTDFLEINHKKKRMRLGCPHALLFAVILNERFRVRLVYFDRPL